MAKPVVHLKLTYYERNKERLKTYSRNYYRQHKNTIKRRRAIKTQGLVLYPKTVASSTLPLLPKVPRSIIVSFGL